MTWTVKHDVVLVTTKEKARGQTQPRWMQADDNHSILVEIFLDEGKDEDAWREAGVGLGQFVGSALPPNARTNIPKTPRRSIRSACLQGSRRNETPEP